MTPKFRGGSDDWLDDEGSSARKGPGGGANARKKPKSDFLDRDAANGTVAEVFPKQCRVRLDADGSEVLCAYRRAAVLGRGSKDDDVEESGNIRERSPVAVGDRVLAERSSPDSGVVKGVCKRRNFLARPAPGRDREETRIRHVIAANVDLLVIVASVEQPQFSPGLIDRFLVAASAGDVSPLVCITKVDLFSRDCAQRPPWNIYQQLGYPLIEVSARQNLGIEELRPELQNKIVVFCGQSGVGKTSLLNSLIGVAGKVGAVNEFTGKGRHTTTSAVLLQAGQSRWIDTPGVREFGLADVMPERLSQHFPEFAGSACAQARCLHLDEEGCSVKSQPRYSSYRRILESLIRGEN